MFVLRIISLGVFISLYRGVDGICHPTVFTKKSKINTCVCGYTLDLTRLVCPALQSCHLISRKYCCSIFPVKIEMLKL